MTMAGPEWQKLLEKLPDLAQMHRQQRFWHLVKVWSIGGAAGALLLGTVAISAKLFSNRSADVTTTTEMNIENASTEPGIYAAPNPEQRQELPIQRGGQK